MPKLRLGQAQCPRVLTMRSSCLAFAAAALSLVAINSSLGQETAVAGQPVKQQPAWLEATLKVWSEQDASAAFAHLEESDDDDVVAQRYAALAQHLYNNRKDVAAMILASRAGIHFNLGRAGALRASDETAAAMHRGHAKTIAYNLGANCWPGWMDEGITLGPAERAIGLDAARLNLRLAIELSRPAEPLAHAHWLLGAQLLAAEQLDAAAAQFAAAAGQFVKATKPTEQQMALTYEKLARRLQHPDDAARHKALAESLSALLALNNDDARFFAEQIRTAEKVFGR